MCGLTYNAHPVGCAAAIATINEYKRLNIKENVALQGDILEDILQGFVKRHNCVGEFRRVGLFAAIELIKDEKIWQSEDSKEYYTMLTDTLRQYIKERYGFNALEMTSFEIIHKLQEVNDETAIAELRELFQTADLVKFAKYSTLINENDRNLVSAIEYINQTKLEEPEEKPQPEVVVVEEKRSKVAKWVLTASIVVVGLMLLAVLAYVAYRVYMLTL